MSIADTEIPTPGATLDGPPATAAALRRARWSTRILFAALGLLAGVWGAHIPSVKSVYALTEATLAMVLFSAAVGSVLSVLFAGRVIARLGTRRASLLTGLVLATSLGLVLLWPGFALLLVATFFFGMAMSVYDVSINAEGTALETQSGRPIMGSLHGMFSVGAAAGATLASLMLKLHWDARWQLAGMAALMTSLLLLAQPGMLDAHPAQTSDAGPATFVWPRGTLLLIGLLIFAGMSAEGVMYDWSVLYLKQEVGLSQDIAAMGYATFAGAMAVARFGGDLLRARFSDAQILRAAATLSAIAMAAVLLTGHPVVAFIGYALVGAGLAPIVPLLFTAASRVPGSSSAAAIGAVSSIGYSGFLVGPPLIGTIAHLQSLTAALSLIVVASTLLAIGVRRIA